MAAGKQTTVTITLSRGWQLLFILAAFAGWLSQAFVFGSATIASGYVSLGTFVFQLTIWLLPIAFFLAAYVILDQHAGWLQRACMASIAATIGLALYNAGAVWERFLWNNYFAGPIDARDASWWTAFGNEWLLMLVSLVLFTAGLYYLVHRRRS